jgi:hypothetical protein
MSDPREWHNLARQGQHAERKKELATLLPHEVSRKKLRQWDRLPASERKMFQISPGRHAMPDPQNDVGLPARL